MKCPVCNLTASVARIETGNDTGGEYVDQVFVCTNPRCTMYAGKDLGTAVVIICKNRCRNKEGQ